MELYIQIRDGKPFEHPIFGDNFREAFPNIDTNNLPPEFARFVRIPRPLLGPYEKNQTVGYEWVDGTVQDVWRCEQMTAEERQAKIDSVLASPHFPSWLFNESTCQWEAPIPYPTDVGTPEAPKRYVWDESLVNWVEVPATQGV